MSLILKDWNVVAAVRESQFGPGKFNLDQIGMVGETDFPDILVVRVADPQELLRDLESKLKQESNFFEAIRMIRPVDRQFEFASPEGFRSRALETVLEHADPLRGKTFDVHVMLRGVTEELGPERLRSDLRAALQERLDEAGQNGAVDTDRPERIVSVEAVAKTAGITMWTDEQVDRYPFLALD